MEGRAAHVLWQDAEGWYLDDGWLLDCTSPALAIAYPSDGSCKLVLAPIEDEDG